MVKNRVRFTVVMSVLTCVLSTASWAQNRIGTGAAKALYLKNCASCHGQDLEGGLAPSLLDEQWRTRGSNTELAQAISEGLLALGMPAWKASLSQDEIRSLVILIREEHKLARKKVRPKMRIDDVFVAGKEVFTLSPLGEGSGILWGVDQLPTGALLVTQKDGILWRFSEKGERQKISGIPSSWQRGQGGLLDVKVHPNYAQNGWVYLSLSISDDKKRKGMTQIVRGKIKNNHWVNQEIIFSAQEKYFIPSGIHFGSRFTFDAGYLYFSIGDRGRQDMAQDPSVPNGKIHRIHDDGRIPKDNPFATHPEFSPTVWTLGHRNPQGLAVDTRSGLIWSSEHGPRGGDEINIISKAENYGWPKVTYGMNYDGSPITALTESQDMVSPKHYWVPSIASAGMDFYQGKHFPHWTGSLFVAGLASKELHRLTIKGENVVNDEVVFSGLGRVRDVLYGVRGELFVLLNRGSPRKGTLYRLMPVVEDKTAQDKTVKK